MVSSGELSGHLAQERADLQTVFGINQQVHMIGRYAVFQKPQVKATEVLPELGTVSVAVSRETEQERSVMAAMGQMEHPSCLW